MTDQKNNIQVRRLSLLNDKLDSDLVSAFSHFECENIEFGLSWLKNLAATALPTGEEATLYIASRSPSEFIAIPLRVGSSLKKASALSTFYTSLYSPIIQTEDPQALLAALFSFLAREEKITSIVLFPMDVNSSVFSCTQKALSQAGWKGLHDYSCFGNWTHTVTDGSYQAYLSSLPSKVRSTIKRKGRKFYDAGKGEINIIEDSSELEHATEQFNSVYQHSWKQEEPYPEFIPHLLALAAGKGWLRLGVATYAGKPIAAQIWLVANGTASIFKLAYHRDYKHLSAGTLLTAHLMEHVIEVDGVNMIDYLTGDDEYKKEWMSHRQERRGIAAYNRSTSSGLTAYALHTVKGFVKKFKR